MYRIAVFLFLAVISAVSGVDAQRIDTLKQRDSLELLQRRTSALLKSDNYAAAIPLLRAALQLDSTNALALRNLGVSFAAQGDTAQARTYLAKAYRFNPKDPEVCYNMAVFSDQAGESAEAIRFFEAAYAIDTNVTMYALGLGGQLLSVGRVQKAMPYLRKAHTLSPDLPAPLFLIGNCFAADRKYDSAVVYYELCVTAGGSSDELYYFLGVGKRYLGKMDEAEKNFKLAISRNPRHKECLQALGLLYAQQGKFVAAGAQFEKVIAIDSQFYAAWASLGATLALTQQEERADTIFKMLLTVDTSWGIQMVRLIDMEKSRQDQKAKGSEPTAKPKK